MTDKKTNGADVVPLMRDKLDNAPVVARPGDGGAGKTARPDPVDRFDGFPVQPLGINGGTYFYLDGLQQLIPLKRKEHGKLDVQSLFVPDSRKTWEYWPRWSKGTKESPSEVVGFACEHASHDLMDSAALKGIFDPAERLRGRGCWRDDNGRLVMHTGNQIYSFYDKAGKKYTAAAPGLIDGYVYPGAATGVKPTEYSASDPGAALMDTLGKWFYNRPIDKYLIFGWICAAMLGGAISWRPVTWITGDSSTGKSTLQHVINTVVGNIVRAGDATAASIWQTLGYQTLPVQLDEVEASEDNRKINKVVELARVAASGDLILRGGSDHVGVQFQARSCFLFSSILIPPLTAQDRNRMVIVELDPIPDGTPVPVLDDGDLRAIGAGLRHKFFTQWHRFDETLAEYQRALVGMGHTNRSADLFGNLLACADMALHKTSVSHERICGLVEQLDPAKLHELTATGTEQQGCLAHLLTAEDDDFTGGQRMVISELVRHASGKDITDAPAYDKRLQRKGLRVVDKGGKQYLLVANGHAGLIKIFTGTRWAGRPGDNGVWRQALERFKPQGAYPWPRPMKFSGVASRCLALPIDLVLPDDDPRDTAPGEMI